MNAGVYALPNQKLLSLLLCKALNLKSLSAQYSAFDTLDPEKQTHNKLRLMMTEHLEHQSITTRLNALEASDNLYFDRIAMTSKFRACVTPHTPQDPISDIAAAAT